MCERACRWAWVVGACGREGTRVCGCAGVRACGRVGRRPGVVTKTCMHICIHKYACMRRCTNTHVPICIRAYSFAYPQRCMHSYLHSSVRRHTDADDAAEAVRVQAHRCVLAMHLSCQSPASTSPRCAVRTTARWALPAVRRVINEASRDWHRQLSWQKERISDAGGLRFESQTGRVRGKSIPSLWRDKHPAIKGLRPPEHHAGYSIRTNKHFSESNKQTTNEASRGKTIRIMNREASLNCLMIGPLLKYMCLLRVFQEVSVFVMLFLHGDEHEKYKQSHKVRTVK